MLRKKCTKADDDEEAPERGQKEGGEEARQENEEIVVEPTPCESGVAERKQRPKHKLWKIILGVVVLLLLVVSLLANIGHSVIESELNDTIVDLRNTVNGQKSTIGKLKAEKQEFVDYWKCNREKIEIFDEYVVFVEKDGTNYYHKYDCYKFREGWAYIIDNAKDMGYKPCSACCPALSFSDEYFALREKDLQNEHLESIANSD